MKKKMKTAAAVLAGLVIAFTLVSHLVFHRSDMASLVEIWFRITRVKEKFEDPEKCEEYIESRRNAGEYSFDTGRLKSDVTETSAGGNKVYHLTDSDHPDYVILYMHGGAYINDASPYHWSLCDRLSQQLNAEVIFPIYPLSPVHTCAETYELMTRVYKEILDTSDVPVIFMGDSAGGGLVLAFSEYLRETDLPQPDKLVLLSPWLDITMSNPEISAYEKSDPMLSAYGLIEMGKCWAGDLDPRDSKVSPIYGDVSGIDNLFVLVGTREIFYPDVTEFCQQLAAQGIHVRLTVEEGMNHVYPLYPIPEAKAALTEICEFIREQNS